MKIEILPIEKIIPYVQNPKAHPEGQIKKLAGAIAEFKWDQPIVVDRDMVIIKGHGRLMAAQALGIKEVPVVVADYLTPAQVKAARIADNKVAESEWFPETLALELQALSEADFDMALTGFDPDELEAMGIGQGGDHPPEDPGPQIDRAAELQEKWGTARGQIWQVGKHRVMCGDSTSAEDVGRLMNGIMASIAFTSPPYNVGALEIDGQVGTQKKYKSFDDNKTEKELYEFYNANIGLLISNSNEIFYNIGLVENNKRVIIDILYNYRDKFKDIIYWKKQTCAPHIQSGIINNLVEFILCFGDGKRKFQSAQFKQGTYWNVIEGSNASGNEYSQDHKATFPLYLPIAIIENFSNLNDIILDSFLGTGTTLIAAEQLGRVCYGMEIAPEYVGVILERASGLGLEPKLIESAEAP